MNNTTYTRKALSDLINNILSLPVWKSDRERVLVYANIYARLTVAETDTAGILTRATQLASKALGFTPDATFNDACYRCNKAVHKLTDSDGEYIWSDEGTLCDKWATDMLDVAAALAATASPAFLPTMEPELIGTHSVLQNYVPIVKNRSNQTRASMPQAVAALDVLFSQAYRLNPVIMNLKHLPMDIKISNNYAAKLVMLKNQPAFEDTFHFRYTLDARGRVYARSLIVTPQGSSFDKAALNFAEAKPLGNYGMQALMIHYANCSGHDKLSFIDRMKWARAAGIAKASKMKQAEGDWRKIKPLIEDKKHQFEEYAAAIDFYYACECEQMEGTAALYLSALVTHQDATNSGFQFGAALTGDRQTADDVNITNLYTKNQKPGDLYGKMATNLNDILSTVELPASCTIPEIDRKFCKTPVMVTGYGAGIKAVMADISADYPDISEEDLEWLKPHVKEALHRTASSMLDLTDVLRKQGETLVTNGAEQIIWTAPDGFRIIQSYRTNEARQVKLSAKLIAHTNLEKGEKDPIDETKMATALPPNFIHSIDGQMLRTAALKAHAKDIAFCPIHDSFGTHAATFFDLNWELKAAFIETMEYDWYANFCTLNHLDHEEIRSGDYSPREAAKAAYMFS